MAHIALSYILTTFNKLRYLEVTLPVLIGHKKADEEIVIVDGGSTDGTKEFLEKLRMDNKIDIFLSEKDHGEAHGTNKALLLARGELLKIVTDDDVFDFRVISKCREFMLIHPEMDITGFDGFGCEVNDNISFSRTYFINGFRSWQQDKIPFLFSGLGFMIRRSSLSYLGLFNPGYKIIDMEYSIRISSQKSRIGFYTGPGFVNLVNSQSNSRNFYKFIKKEQKVLSRTYPSINVGFTLNNPLLRIREHISSLLPARITYRNEETEFSLYHKAFVLASEELKGYDHQKDRFLTDNGLAS